jgi:aryl-alcohol dehydrogenase-like predicted oxidoreductase
MKDDASKDEQGEHAGAEDETRPLQLGRRRKILADPEPAVAAALAVIERSLRDMAQSQTRPLLDPPPTPFRLRRVGGTDLEVFPVVLGGAGLAEAQDFSSAHRLLDGYAAAGGNAVLLDDHAEGRAAQAVGTWLAARARRDAVVLGARIGAAAGGMTAAGLPAAVERLLNRLGTDRLDVVVLASTDRGTAFEETMTAAAGLLKAGKVRHFLAGDHGGDRLMEARIMAGQRGLPRLEGVAPVYSLLHRAEYEQRVAPVVHAQELACLPRSPLAGGFLAGDVPTRSALRRLRELEPARAERLQPALTRRGIRIVDALLKIALERDVQAGSVALAWLLTRPHVTAPVVAARTVEQVWTATAAAGLHLTRAEATALDRASAD